MSGTNVLIEQVCNHGLDFATSSVTSYEILQNYITPVPNGISTSDGTSTIYLKNDACRVLTGNKNDDHKITFCGSQPDFDNGAPSLEHEQLSQDFLHDATTVAGHDSQANKYIDQAVKNAQSTSGKLIKL